MGQAARWGKPFKDERDWLIYNEELVVRGEFLLDFDWVKNWNKELEDMNDGKVGAKFLFPESMIELQAVWAQWLDVRALEGCARQLAKQGLLPAYDDYTTIWRRISEVETKIKIENGQVYEASSDGTGMKMNCAGEYRETKYDDRTYKKFIHVTITADPRRKKLLAVSACIEGAGDSESVTAKAQMTSVIADGNTISKAYGDGSFDTHPLFNFLEQNGIKSAIKIRKNASSKSNGSMRRSREVRAYKRKGYPTWADEVEYGMRWPGTEGFFSAVKRKFGEKSRSKYPENMCQEAQRRFWAYDRISEYAKNR